MRLRRAKRSEAPTRRRSFAASALFCFIGGFSALVVTALWLGDIHRHGVVWPVTGVILAILLRGKRDAGKDVLLTAAAITGLGLGGFVCGMPFAFCIVIAARTALDVVVAAFIVRGHVSSFEDLRVARNGQRLVACSIIAPLLSGFIGAGQWMNLFRQPSILLAAGTSALANALGITLFVPLLLCLTTEKLSARKRTVRWIPATAALVFFCLTCVGTFWQSTGPYLFLIFPPMMLLLLIFGLEGAVFSSVFVSLIGTWATTHQHGPITLIHTSSVEVRLVALQMFFWIVIITALPIGAALDERRKAEQSATDSLSAQRTILKYTRDAMVLSSLDGKDRFASDAIEQLTGWTPTEYVGRSRTSMLHPDDRARGLQMLEDLRLGIQEASLRYRLLHKSGDWKWVEASFSAYGEGGTAGYVGTIRDITDLVETEQVWMRERQLLSDEQRRLSEAENAAQYQVRLRDEFLSHVSHELRSPLTSISSFTSIIADGLAGATTVAQDEYLGIVIKNVIQLQAMIEDLLTVTQSREGKLSIEPRRISMRDAFADVLNTLKHRADRKSIKLICRHDAVVDFVFADPTRVRQVLIILIDNAIKFTPVQGTICVTTSSTSPDSILVKVIDNGCGIARDKWDLVFKKLYQVGGSDTLDRGDAGRSGLGLGLHIAESLVLRQSGKIWVTSVLGKGSVFHFTLPLDH